ncbi:MAG: radical SAM family heme chaperone HemW [Bacteroidota bacterium]
MAGIYIHVPFCKSKCHYCDFFKSTKVDLIEQYLDRLNEEIAGRKAFFDKKETLNTIYFGGGTPSLLSAKSITQILQNLFHHFNFSKDPEITLEANPDDLFKEYLHQLKESGINRLSIGIQSFFEEDLIKMGRRHSAHQSHQVLSDVFEAGFENVGTDLIYGLPWSNQNRLKENLRIFWEYPVKHLSAYHLTIEPGTRFGKDLAAHQLKELTGEESEKRFRILTEETAKQGFEHYEISNFCKPGWPSRHNSAYWTGEPYLGLGPAAHSFNGRQRIFNLPDINGYIEQGYQKGIRVEELKKKDLFNENLMLGLRTQKGIDVKEMEENFPDCWQKILPLLDKWIKPGFLDQKNGRLFSTSKGWFVIDGIIEDLFVL